MWRIGLVIRLGLAALLLSACASGGTSGEASGGTLDASPAQEDGETAAPEGDPVAEPDLGLLQPGTIIAVATSSSAPTSYIEDGELTGHTIELVREAAQRLDLEVEFRLVENAAAGEAQVSTGQADLIAAYVIPPTPERLERFLFTQPVNYGTWAYLAQASDGFASEEALEASSSIGTLEAGAQRTYLESRFAEEQLVGFPDNASQLTALVSGQVDAIFVGGSFVETALERYPDLALVAQMPVPNPGGFLVRLEAEGLRDVLDAQLDDLYADCTYTRLWEQFYPGQEISEQLLEEHAEVGDCPTSIP